MDNLKDYKIAVIGAGIIGGAIADALSPYCQVMATRRSKEKLEEIKKKGIETTQDNVAAATWADVVVVAVKPKQIVPVLQEVTSAIEDKLVISFAAAISLDIMRRVAPRSRFIRAMTNIAAIVRKGYTVYAYGGEVLQKDIALAEAIFANLGEARAVDEQFLDVLTAMFRLWSGVYLHRRGVHDLWSLEDGVAPRFGVAGGCPYSHWRLASPARLWEASGRTEGSRRHAGRRDDRGNLRIGRKPHTHGIYEGYQRCLRKGATILRRCEGAGGKNLKGHQRGLGLAPAFQWINFLNSWKEVLSSLGLLSEGRISETTFPWVFLSPAD